MNYLLDTHAIIWSIVDTKQLSKRAREIIENPENALFVSPLSFWEISIKTALGKFDFHHIDIRHIPNICREYGFTFLEQSPYDYITNFELPKKENHKDPFDRMLIHSAIKNELILLSRDSLFKQYESEGLQLAW